MNFVNIKTVRLFISVGLLLGLNLSWAWDVDFSRRRHQFSQIQDEQNKQASRGPASVEAEEPPGIKEGLTAVFANVGSSQDIVLLNTEKGFVPDTLNLVQGFSYKIHVVNLNKKHKNGSFVLDDFGQSRSTVYSESVEFKITPKTEGVFSFVSPESANKGRIIVVPASRRPAGHGSH